MSNFITNTPKETTLKDRLEELIAHSVELKFLVGYFYFSGWQALYAALRRREDLRLKILVGLEIDARLGRAVEIADPHAATRTQDEIAERFFASLRAALNDENLDTPAFYEQTIFFLRLIEEGRLEIRKTLDPNHAKLYLFRLDEAGQRLTQSPGRFITGSSNLTRAGLEGQQEFNVEIGDYGWEAAEAWFDDLWDTAVPITAEENRRARLLRTVRRESQAAEITPFEAYALTLKTYLDLVSQKNLMPSLRRLMEARGYTPYRYQMDAVTQALNVVEKYNGVIIADVVGLGKSVIASALARQLGGRGLVICPPGLMGDPKTRASGWYKYLADFGLFDWEVYSLGALDKVQDYLAEYGDDVATIIVDEAHRFRNEDTEAYERLSQICANRRVILLTATPFNNAPSDIFALLKLFIPPGKSTITLDDNLTRRFARYNQAFRRFSYIMRYHDAGGDKQRRAERYYTEDFEVPLPIDLARVHTRTRQLAAEIRAVIAPVLIRRNRLDLRNDPLYNQEVTALSEVADPQELFFDLTPAQSAFYDRVVNDYFGEEGQFHGAIYQPFAYEEGRRQLAEAALDEARNRTYQQQRNLYDFMRRLLVKRFESSFGAFAQSIRNFIRVHEMVLAFIEKSGRYVLDRQLIEKVYTGDEDEIDDALEAFARRLAEKETLNPRHDRIYDLAAFADADAFLEDIRADLALFRRIEEEITALDLVGRDPKAARLVEAVREILKPPPPDGEPRRKVVIFSEYRDTVRHLAPVLKSAFPEQLLVVDGPLSSTLTARILANFDASVPAEKQQDDFQILLATDKLSEGVNLNRAGAIINYDIPWNPTRVIQRVGRINRIGRKVFERLYIYNFFPTEQGADVVHSREIAAHKMFLIHNTLGEDAKIFDPGEEPTPAALFRRINRNPEEEEEESTLTRVRRAYYEIRQAHPDLAARLSDFPPRVKTAKHAASDELLVFRRKGLQLFVHTVPDTRAEKPEVRPLTFEEALEHIACDPDTPRLPLSKHFWPAYEAAKKRRTRLPAPKGPNTLEAQAENNLRSALYHHSGALDEAEVTFTRTLLKDLKDYQTLPKYTLRRLAAAEVGRGASENALRRFKAELARLRRILGDDYLDRLEKRLAAFRSEVIIAVENQKRTT